MAADLPKITLVLGGARSGKSDFAEKLAMDTGARKIYIASAQAIDAEMSHRIADHITRRGDGWTTMEEPLDLVGALAKTSGDSVVLVDCLTLWLSNHMLANHAPEPVIEQLMTSLSSLESRVIFVSNEIGMGLVPDTALARRFRDAHGAMNRNVAARADLAVLVAAGLPLVLKGQLPGNK